MNELIENLDNINELTSDELSEMNFYETALYIQTLNKVEKLYDEISGDNYE